MTALLLLLAMNAGAPTYTTALPPAAIRYGADRYCARIARLSVTLFNYRIEGAREKDLEAAASSSSALMHDPAAASLLLAVVERFYHGPHPLRTRRQVIDYSYHYCMNTPVSAPAT